MSYTRKTKADTIPSTDGGLEVNTNPKGTVDCVSAHFI